MRLMKMHRPRFVIGSLSFIALALLPVFMGIAASPVIIVFTTLQWKSGLTGICMVFAMGLGATGGISILCHVNTRSTQHYLRRYWPKIVDDGRFLNCLKCNYDLRGSPSGICPECGHNNHVVSRQTT